MIFWPLYSFCVFTWPPYQDSKKPILLLLCTTLHKCMDYHSVSISTEKNTDTFVDHKAVSFFSLFFNLNIIMSQLSHNLVTVRGKNTASQHQDVKLRVKLSLEPNHTFNEAEAPSRKHHLSLQKLVRENRVMTHTIFPPCQVELVYLHSSGFVGKFCTTLSYLSPAVSCESGLTWHGPSVTWMNP